MSFARQVKQELVRYAENHDCCNSWELTAFLLLKGYLSICEGKQTLVVQTDYNYIARRLFSLLKAAGIESPLVVLQKKQRLGVNRYLVQVDGTDRVEALLLYLGLKESGQANHLSRDAQITPQEHCCRGLFRELLAAGSVNIQALGYHLEINSYEEDTAALQIAWASLPQAVSSAAR